MIPLDRTANKLLYATTRIQGRHSNGTESVGTAFFFAYKLNDGGTVTVLITNKHVVKDVIEGTFTIHEAVKDQNDQYRPSGEHFRVVMGNFENNWVMHPNEDVDLCAMPFAPLRQLAANNGKYIALASFEETMIYNQEQLNALAALEEVLMIGYPNGLWDDVNNFPILRKGITASHPAADFQGRPVGVVDIAAVPGSSGSPIMIFNEGAYSSGGGITVGSRLIFLGLLFAGPQMRADGIIQIVDVPTASVPVVSTMVPMHLGFYIKASELLTLKQHLFASFNVL